MIIVDPDEFVATRLTYNGVTEALINLDVDLPLRIVIPHVRLKKMQEGPEGTVTYPVIILLDIPRAQEHRYTTILVPE